jgi:hypothetical protein
MLCHLIHNDVAELLGPTAPDAWLAVSEGERLEAELTPDVCIMPDDGRTRHFVRGHIQLPVLDADPPVFVWSVWVELDEVSMSSIARSWSNPNRAAIPPLQGRLATGLPYEQPTRGLTISVHTRDLNQVPLLMVEDPRHLLALEQAEGVSLHRVAELAAMLRQ